MQAEHPKLFASGHRKELVDRSGQAHAWIGESVFINEKDLARADARRLLEGMAKEVRSGKPFDAVEIQTRRTFSHLGTYGDWVASNRHLAGEPFRFGTRLPKDHLEKLLNARSGDLLVLDNNEPREPRVILYHVREVYQP